MSKNYEKVKSYYNKKLWSLSMVFSAVGKWITENEYKLITGKTYSGLV